MHQQTARARGVPCFEEHEVATFKTVFGKLRTKNWKPTTEEQRPSLRGSATTNAQYFHTRGLTCWLRSSTIEATSV
eukprot:6182807-Pleurochrysis_carterae.AAC.3